MKPYAVVIQGNPARAFYEDATTLRGLDPAAVASEKTLREIRTMRAGTEGENGSVEFTLSAASFERFRNPPINAPAFIVDAAGVVVFDAIVSGVNVSRAGIDVTLEQFGGDDLPLRTSAAWGGFRTATTIPDRIGTTGGYAIQYDANRTVFVWAGHESAGVDSVSIGGADPGGWTADNGVDSDGHAATFIRFGSPVDEGVDVLVRGRGMMHPDTGELMTNPADVMFEFLSRDPHFTGTRAQFSAFRIACATLGLEAGGSVEEAGTGQAFARAIAASVGARYSPDAKDVAFLDPAAPDGPALAVLTDRNATLTAAVTNDGLVNDLTVQFDFEAGQPRQVIRLQCPDSIATYGSKPQTFAAQWITSSRVAIDVGTRLVAYQARPRWIVTAADLAQGLRVGDLVSVSSSTLADGAPPATLGPYRVLTRELDPQTGKTQVTLEVPIGGAPAVVLVSQATQYDPNVYPGGSVAQQGSDVSIHLFDIDSNGNVTGDLANAAVTLDGDSTNTRQTDATGHVSFPRALLPPGQHYVTFVTSDGRTGRMDFTV